MSDARWIEIESDFKSAESHFLQAAQLFARLRLKDRDDDAYYLYSMGFMHAMLAGHTSLESGLTRIFAILGEELSSGDRWHADLIDRAAREIPNERPAIIPARTAKLAHDTRKFRHVAAKTYDSFEPTEAVNSVASATELASRIGADLASFKALIDPPANNGGGDGSGGRMGGGPSGKRR